MIRTPEIDLVPILPELVLCATAIVGLLYEAFARPSDRRVHVLVASIGLAGTAAVSVLLWNHEGTDTVLQGMVSVDRFSVLARVLLVAIAAFALVYGTHYFARSGDEARGEFYPLLLFATAGMTLITAANDLIVTFLALEILSLSLYVLTGITGRRGSSEAAMKYFLLGAFSSAFFLYGVAMAYGATGTTKIRGIANALTGTTGDLAIVLLAFAFLAVAFAFKVSSVPFHMWTPDVYQGAPTPVTAYMSAATKVAAFMALIRVLDVAFQPITWDWTPVVWVLAAASMIVGSVLAIAQSDVKRMLAYSSIAHAGFILTGLTAADQTGIRAALFYLIAYSIMTLGAFGIVMLVSARGEEQTSFASYAGLARRSPLLAGLMTLFLLSLAGIPPTVGFIAKAGVFGAAIGAGYWPLALIGVASSVVAAFFYLRLIVLMYMQEPQGEHDRDPSLMPRVAIAIPAFLTLALGIFPGLLSDILREASVLRW
ncbi:MAG TPA: NADH-quinone oxidoreductase subunit NuoN [Actinomycetota bacterium]